MLKYIKVTATAIVCRRIAASNRSPIYCMVCELVMLTIACVAAARDKSWGRIPSLFIWKSMEAGQRLTIKETKCKICFPVKIMHVRNFRFCFSDQCNQFLWNNYVWDLAIKSKLIIKSCLPCWKIQFKGTVHSKIKFCHHLLPQVFPNPIGVSSMEHKWRCLSGWQP